MSDDTKTVIFAKPDHNFDYGSYAHLCKCSPDVRGAQSVNHKSKVPLGAERMHIAYLVLSRIGICAIVMWFLAVPYCLYDIYNSDEWSVDVFIILISTIQLLLSLWLTTIAKHALHT